MRCIVLFSKAPIPGEVKTRLTPHFSYLEASKLHEAFVIDTLSTISRIKDIDIYIACHPDRECDFFQIVKKRFNLKLVNQGTGNLGERMKNVFGELRAKGYNEMVAVGSDSPTLPKNRIEEAFCALKRRKIVIGPSIDGGYYLIGFKGEAPDIFDGISWGRETVFDETIEKLKKQGKEFSLLPFWYDVDTVREVRFLAIHLGYIAAHQHVSTRDVLSDLGHL